MKKFLLLAITCLSFSHVCAQLVVNTNCKANLVESLTEQGMTISNITLSCPSNAYGTFSNGNTTNMGITNGVLLTTGGATNAVGPNSTTSIGVCVGNSMADAQLVAIAPQFSYDVCVLEFDVVPQSSKLNIRFVFGSEEYPEFVDASFNDAFGFFISGPGPSCQNSFYNKTNIATLPNNTTPVSIDNVNGTANAAYYVNNTAGTTRQYDGCTTVLTRTIALSPHDTKQWQFAIANGGGHSTNPGVLLDFLAISVSAQNVVSQNQSYHFKITWSDIEPILTPLTCFAYSLWKFQRSRDSYQETAFQYKIESNKPDASIYAIPLMDWEEEPAFRQFKEHGTHPLDSSLIECLKLEYACNRTTSDPIEVIDMTYIIILVAPDDTYTIGRIEPHHDDPEKWAQINFE